MAHHNPWPDEGNTGHIWDEDLRELDNPPPLWWMLSFYASFVMIIFYSLYYPTIPLVDSHTKGLAGWTQIGEYHDDFAVLNNWRNKKFAEEEEKLAALSVAEILKDDELRTYAVKTSKMLFGDYCAACHGSGGQGVPNFPVLADDDWLFGGTGAAIKASISGGRIGSMPAKGLLGNMTDEDMSHVADYVIALSEGKGEDSSVALGKAAYAKGMCMACHGPVGKPFGPTGAANLTDYAWRFGSDKQTILDVITYGVNVKKDGELIKGTKNAIMPSFKDRLPNPEVNIKRLAVYVHELGGGMEK